MFSIILYFVVPLLVLTFCGQSCSHCAAALVPGEPPQTEQTEEPFTDEEFWEILDPAGLLQDLMEPVEPIEPAQVKESWEILGSAELLQELDKQQPRQQRTANKAKQAQAVYRVDLSREQMTSTYRQIRRLPANQIRALAARYDVPCSKRGPVAEAVIESLAHLVKRGEL